MPEFEVTIARTTVEITTITISAPDEEEAETRVKKLIEDGVSNIDWTLDDQTLETEEVSEV